MIFGVEESSEITDTESDNEETAESIPFEDQIIDNSNDWQYLSIIHF